MAELAGKGLGGGWFGMLDLTQAANHGCREPADGRSCSGRLAWWGLDDVRVGRLAVANFGFRSGGDRVDGEAMEGRITIEPGKRGSQPCVRGMRIGVADVLEYLSHGASREQLMEDFPELEPEDINACLAFAAHREWHLQSMAS